MLAPTVSYSANQGNIIIQNNDTTTGTINIGNDATVSANGTSHILGWVFITMGNPVHTNPYSCVNCAGDDVVNVGNAALNIQNNGVVWLGDNGINAPASPVTISVDGAIVIVNGSSPSSITIGAGALISAKDPPPPQEYQLPSLDFVNGYDSTTQQTIIQDVQFDQLYTFIGGKS